MTISRYKSFFDSFISWRILSSYSLDVGTFWERWARSCGCGKQTGSAERTNTHRLLCAIGSYVHLCASAHVCMHHRGTPLTPICLPSSRMIQLQATTSTSCTTSYTQSFVYARPRDHISYKQRPSGTPVSACDLFAYYKIRSPIRKN